MNEFAKLFDKSEENEHVILKQPEILDSQSLARLFDDFNDELNELAVISSDFKITNEEANCRALEMMTQLKELLKKIEDKRVETKKPFFDVTSFLDKSVKKLKDKIKDIEKKLYVKVINAGYVEKAKKRVWDIKDFKMLPDDIIEKRKEQIKKAVTPVINEKIKAGMIEISGVVFTEVETFKL